MEHITGDADNEGITAHGVSNLFGSRPVREEEEERKMEMFVRPHAILVFHKARHWNLRSILR
jgi:hypothetical protein